MVWTPSRASCAARSAPTPQSELTGAASGEVLVSGGHIARTIQTAELNLNHRDFRAAVEADVVVINVANSRVDVERTCPSLEQAEVVFIHTEWRKNRAVERNADLSAVRMAGQQ